MKLHLDHAAIHYKVTGNGSDNDKNNGSRHSSSLVNLPDDVEVMDTPAACRTYNILAGEGRRVAAVLLLSD